MDIILVNKIVRINEIRMSTYLAQNGSLINVGCYHYSQKHAVEVQAETDRDCGGFWLLCTNLDASVFIAQSLFDWFSTVFQIGEVAE